MYLIRKDTKKKKKCVLGVEQILHELNNKLVKEQ